MIVQYKRCHKCLGSGMIEVEERLEVCPECQGDGIVTEEYGNERNEKVLNT